MRALGLAALAVYLVHGLLDSGGSRPDALLDGAVYPAIILAAAVGCAARARRERRERSAWSVLAGAMVLWSAGELGSTLAGVPMRLAESAQLAFYPAAVVALALLARARVRHRPRLLWVDAGVAALAVCAITTAWLWEPVTRALGTGPDRTLVDIAYPVGDLLLLGLVIGVVGLTGWRPDGPWSLLAGGFLLAAGADLAYLAGAGAAGTFGATALAAAWPASTLLLAEAARRPAAARHPPPPQGLRVLVVPIGSAALALLLVLYGNVARVDGLALVLAAGTLAGAGARMVLTFAENGRIAAESRREALTDALTGLGNRRRLFADLAEALGGPPPAAPHLLVLFDLDGFKQFNDTFGHPAGDGLLTRLGTALRDELGAGGHAYRLGGDEFCALVAGDREAVPAVLEATSAALREEGEGYVVRSSQGIAVLPEEAATPSEVLKLADARLYQQKHGRRRAAAGQETAAALLQVLRAREPDPDGRGRDVVELAIALGRRSGLRGDGLADLARAVELHDVGTSAIPDAVLGKAGPLDAREWGLIHQHTIVGERILAAAPALAGVARLVRASHECFDGSGYPDGLRGADIPLGARILAVCTAWEAMTADRPYREALAPAAAMRELDEGAGTQFDPAVIAALRAELGPALLASERLGVAAVVAPVAPR